jgi:hypothetical protein
MNPNSFFLMKRTKTTIILPIIIAVISSGILLSSCRKKSMDGMIICTLVEGNAQMKIKNSGDSLQYISHARIAAIDPDKPNGALIILTNDYFSAMSPDVSFDCKYLLFAAKRKQNDPWQIFEMNLADRKVTQITSSKENCVDPAYLPNGRVVFSMINTKDEHKSGYSLYTCTINGTDLKRITYNPHSYSCTSILKDGRILTVSRQLYPEKCDPLLMAMRPDGTKAELFYKGLVGSSLISKGCETASGKLLFIEDEGNAHGSKITSINYNRPLHTRISLTSGIKGDFCSVFPLTSGKLLVSYRQSATERYGLFEFDPDNKTLGKSIFSHNEFDVSEAVFLSRHERPKKLPSEVDMGVKTGLLLCQDINSVNPEAAGNHNAVSKASSIEVMGTDSTLGVVKVAKDGSFYLKVVADKPFQIRALDENGNVLNKSCGWIWLRPNERRGCVGCHEDHEQTPENRVPLAVKSPPVNIPVHIIKVKEKKVELE